MPKKTKTPPKPKRRFEKLRAYLPAHKKAAGLIAAFVLVAAATAWFLVNTAGPLKASVEQPAAHRIDVPIVLRLNQKLKEIPTNSITITPATEGKWTRSSAGVFGHDTLTFTPKGLLVADTAYTVKLPTMTRILMGNSSAVSAEFKTERAPSVMKTGLASVAENSTVPADMAFTVEFASPIKQLRTLAFSISPEIEVRQKAESDKTYTWQPTSMLPQGQPVTVTVSDTQNKEVILKKTLNVASEPSVAGYAKEVYFTPDDTATITFGQPIDEESKKFITFDAEGQGSWENDTTYRFKPTNLQPGRTYGYKIGQGLRSKEGGVLTKDIGASFRTTGPVAVVGTGPQGAGLAQSRQVLTFTFDQAVDKQSAASHLVVSSGKVGDISWKGNTMNVVVTDLGFQQNFSATIGAGVANAGFGLPSAQAYGLSFTTEARSTKLAVPVYRQQHSATCTAASLRMALAYRGAAADEIGLVNAMGYAPRDIDKSTDPPTWDDSSQMFVGSIDGSIAKGTGAGPDAPPVAKAARAYGHDASVMTGASVNWVAEQLYAGNPVIIFGAFKNTGYTTWQTPSGKKVIMNLTGHARVAIGVVGEPSNPIGFWVNDPLSGTAYWSAGALAGNMSLDPDRQAVVVY